MQAHYFVSLAGRVDAQKRSEIEENAEEKLKYEELLNTFGFGKK